jgi:hypothetical protein
MSGTVRSAISNRLLILFPEFGEPLLQHQLLAQFNLGENNSYPVADRTFATRPTASTTSPLWVIRSLSRFPAGEEFPGTTWHPNKLKSMVFSTVL